MILLKNCNLINMAGIYEENYDILIDGKTIRKIEKNINTNDYKDIKIIDVDGKLVTPGLIESHCHMGIYETAVPEGIDGNETTNPVLPGLRAIDAIDPLDSAYDVAIKHGITTVVTGPGSANVMGGTFCAMKTAGKSLDRNIIKEEATFKMALGENPKTFYGGKGIAPKTRMMSAALMREALFKAKKYHEDYNAYLNGEKESYKYDLHMHSLMRAFDEMRVKIHAHQADDIMTGIRISEEFGLNYTIDHCTGGSDIVDELVDHNVDCIIGPSAGGKGKYELKNKGFKLGKLLQERNVDFAITTDHPVIPIEGLLMQLAMYVKNGVTEENALKAVTINAARVTDIDKYVGSIEVGKDADIVIWEVGPLKTMSKTDMVIVNGEIVYEGEEGEYDVDYKNTNLYNMNDINGEKKDIIVENGKIIDILGEVELSNYKDAEIIDANNQIVTPGLVEAHCAVGIQEQVHKEGADLNESTDPITPQLRGIDAINPEDEGFSMALSAGVTTAITGPGNINLIGGTFAAIKTYGNTVEKMSIEDEIAFKFSLGNVPKGFYGGKGKSPKTRLANAALIREALYKAKAYHEQMKKYENNETSNAPAFDMKLQSLSRVFDGMLVKFHAQQAYDIMTAVRIAEEFGLNYTVDKCSEAYLITEDLKNHNVKLVVGATYGGKRTHEIRNQDTIIGKVLEEEGIDFCISSGHPDINIDLTMIQPIMMVRKGLSREKALRGVTIDAARAVGLDNRLGSIEVGKDADIVIWSGEPLDYYGYAQYVIIDGNVVLKK